MISVFLQVAAFKTSNFLLMDQIYSHVVKITTMTNMTGMFRFLGVCLLWFLAGCTLGDPSSKGDVSGVPAEPWTPCRRPLYSLSLSSSAKRTLDLESIARRGALGMSDLIDIALANNPKTYQSWAQARAAAFAWEAAKSPYYPTITGRELLNFQKSKGGSSSGLALNSGDLENVDPNSISAKGATGMAGSTGPNRELGFQYNQTLTQDLFLSYLLLDFGGREANYESTRQALMAANWTHNQTLQGVILQVMQSYYLYLQTMALIDAKKEQLKDALASSQASEAQFQAGIVNKVDFLLAKTNYLNVQLQLEQLEGKLNINRGQVAAALGYSAATPLNLADIPKELPLNDVETNVEHLIEIALQQRPDLASAYAIYFANEELVTVASSAGLPTLSAFGNIHKLNNIHTPSQNGELYSGALALNVPIFAGFFYVNNTRQAKEHAWASLASVEQLQSDISYQVVSSYYNLKIAIATVKNAEEYLIYAQESFNAASLNYNVGTGSILDLLTAQTALANARSQLIDAKTEWLTSLANLAYATGALTP